ncbi:hypothetical protein ACMDB5_02840 [Flavobacterium sp. W1B]|uniref:hypothetical protein n=1 Tax=Flavobacterium sp. W1B TaxID=3394146 RepID=UPI0039BC8959
MDSPCIIIPILVGLICALLGYLLGKLFSSAKDSSGELQLELDKCQARSSKLEAELMALKAKATAPAAAQHEAVSGLISAFVPFDTIAASDIFEKKINENDLKIIEGIGPKIEELFHANGITTWETLCDTPVSRCQEILDKEGERFVIHNPETWPYQAKLAFEGKWRELKKWQEAHIGGRK